MKTRLKTYKEFLAGIIMVNTTDKGVKFVCKKKNYVMLHAQVKPWNTVATKKSFLVRLYIKEIVQKINPSKKIARIKDFELLGGRCAYNGRTMIVCDKYEGVDPETGNMDTVLVVVHLSRTAFDRSDPFLLLQSQIDLI